ncbi:hypothetical protein ACFL1M_02840 [Patescibacteria group bacterium]
MRKEAIKEARQALLENETFTGSLSLTSNPDDIRSAANEVLENCCPNLLEDDMTQIITAATMSMNSDNFSSFIDRLIEARS